MINVTATSLGIDLTEPSGHGLYKWLLASFLMGKRIRSTVAIKAYHLLVDQQGLDSPGKLANCPHRELVRILGQAGYARYDESSARRLRQLGERLDAELNARVHAARATGEALPELRKWLLSFEGIGPKTLEIFMREAEPLLTHPG